MFFFFFFVQKCPELSILVRFLIFFQHQSALNSEKLRGQNFCLLYFCINKIFYSKYRKTKICYITIFYTQKNLLFHLIVVNKFYEKIGK